MIKILYIITGLHVGGAEMMLYRLVKGLDKQTYSICVVSLLPLGLVAKKIESVGIEVFSVNMRHKLDVKAFYRLFKIIRKQRPKILHCFMFHANLIGRIMGKILKVPNVISSVRNTYFGGRIRELLLRWTDRWSDATTIVCKAAADRMIERRLVTVTKMHIIYNGLDLNSFTPLNPKERQSLRFELGSTAEDGIVIISVGRLEAQKGYFSLLNAAARLKDKGVRFKWFIVGKGEMEPKLRHLCTLLNVNKEVMFLGLRQDVDRLLRAADIFVLASFWEGLPGVVMEAMAAELPVVATNVGGTPELVKEGVTGYLVPPKDPEQMAKAIADMISLSKEDRTKMGRMGYERIKTEFNVQQMVQKNVELYQHSPDKKTVTLNA